jgi:hypothetical protein
MTHDRFAHPFVPAESTGSGADQDARVRIAHALEFIAFQLGDMNARLKTERPADDDAVGERLAKKLAAGNATAVAAGLASLHVPKAAPRLRRR